MVDNITNLSEAYFAAKQNVALMDRSHWGRIEITGADRLEFLQRMSTNDFHGLTPGCGLQTVLTTSEARIMDLLTVYVRDDSLLCVTSPENRSKVIGWFRRNIFFRDKVKAVDASERLFQFSLFGPRSRDVLGNFAQTNTLPSAPFAAQILNNLAGAVEVLVAMVPYIAGGGYDLIGQRADAERIWQTLLTVGTRHGLRPIAVEAFDVLRIESGQPRYGHELSEEHNPLEARLNHAISFSKGCYTGQEVIARLDTYQKLKQVLVGFRLSELPRQSVPITFSLAGVEAGQITSVAQLPEDGAILGLGYVRVKLYQPGAVVAIQDGERQIEAVMSELPFTFK